MIDSLTTRPGTPADAALLFALFAETKAQELGPLGLSIEQMQPLLEMQYRGRELTYAQASPMAVNAIVCLQGGTPVGRLLIDQRLQGYRVIDIAVLSAYRRRGIASWALRRVQAAAAKESVPVRLRVMKSSDARRLYERLGFAEISDDAIFCEMEWQPPADHGFSKEFQPVPQAHA